MMLSVSSGEKSYDIVLESGALSSVGRLLDLNRNVLIVTDSGVPAAYTEAVAAVSRSPVTVRLPKGEQSKSMENFQTLLQTMLDSGFTRSDCVVAVGGGMVGDLAGFAAACYMRGIDFFNVPTTLLSQVDSSIGGKTAVDFGGVKNSVGAFYPPKKVIIDPETLKTLDERQLHAGLAEAIKMAAACDAELFSLLENCGDLQNDLPEIIRRSLLIKKAVVEKDPGEQGLRRVLNFGHTIGHAIEACENGNLLHGECVALGMPPMCTPAVRQRLIALLRRYGLPVEIRQKKEELLPWLLHDKKRTDTRITAVLVDEIGSFRFREMTPEEILNRMEALQ